MPITRPLFSHSILCALAATALPACGPAAAQAVATPPGVYLEIEGQAVFGDSDFAAGFVPPSDSSLTGPKAKLDEGDGRGGAVVLGYAWTNGWNTAVRFRRLDADESGGPIDPGIVSFFPGIPVIGGVPIGFPEARTKVDSETSIFDFEAGKDVAVGGGRLHLFGGITYASIERNVAVIDDTCGCAPLALLMANDFHGLGPRIGFRGGVPVSNGVSLVGGASIAALFGTSTFASRINDPFVPGFKHDDDRTVAAIDGEAGLAFAVGPGSLTVGYRVNAIFEALDTDQRVSDLFVDAGLPEIGDTHSDFVEHGPFVRFALPLAGLEN